MAQSRALLQSMRTLCCTSRVMCNQPSFLWALCCLLLSTRVKIPCLQSPWLFIQVCISMCLGPLSVDMPLRFWAGVRRMAPPTGFVPTPGTLTGAIMVRLYHSYEVMTAFSNLLVSSLWLFVIQAKTATVSEFWQYWYECINGTYYTKIKNIIYFTFK